MREQSRFSLTEILSFHKIMHETYTVILTKYRSPIGGFIEIKMEIYNTITIFNIYSK